MSYEKPSSRRRSRLSTRVRIGVAVVAACFVTSPVYANPLNPTVVNGTATFNQAGSVLTVTNSNGAIINWDKFSIKTGETTHFAQTAASSTVLNRVLNDPTVIYGTLSSNGQVWLVNPAGIMVGPGGLINTAGFVASTLAIRNEDFLAGRHLFVNDGSAKNVINQGEIRTPSGGSVYLIGSNVTNEGIITTPQGETILAAGATVSLIDSATPGVRVDITGAEGNATNLGTITAEAGRIGIAGVIVRNSGTLNASSVVSEGGRIFLKASQDAYVDGNGRIVTTGTKGGSVEVLGNRVAVMDNAVIDASGTYGGGSILVGGDYQGKNPEIQNASITYFGPGATLKADATEVGDGGTVIIWADDTMRAYGNISARGGASGGNGGFVETSGKNYLAVDGIRVDTRAPQGQVGTWLLDPNDITIVASDGGTPTNGTYGGDPWQFVATADPSTVGWNTLVTALGLTEVNVTTSDGSITIGADQTYNSTNSLYLLAGGDINAVGRTVTNVNSGGIGLVAGWDSSSGLGASATPYGGAGAGAINASSATFSTGGGDITLLARNNITVGSLITKGYDGGAGSNGGDAGSVTVHSQSGDIYITSVDARGGTGGDGGEGGVGNGGSGGSVTLTSAGNIEVNGNITTKGGDGGISAGYGFSGGAGGSAGTIMLTASSGSIALTNAQLSANGGKGGYGTRACSDCGYEAGSGGTIMLNSYGGITMTDSSISANGGNGGNAGVGYAGYAGGGGSITLSSSYGGISMTGSSISAKGGNGGSAGYGNPGSTGYAGYAGDGGSIQLNAASSITLTSSQISARGGNGGHSFGYGYGTDGGGGGSIMLFSNIAGEIALTGTTLNVQGGTGGNSTYGGYSGGWGGTGGTVNLQTTDGSIVLNSGSFIYANGGMGGAGSNDDAFNGYGAYSGGRGGDGGNVTLGANGPVAGISMSGSGITASGGGGGAGGAGGSYVGYGGDGGDGGEGGSVFLDAARAIQSASMDVSGGAGGAAGAGFGGYDSGLVGAIGGGGSAGLFSQYGGAAGGLAINADVFGSGYLSASASGSFGGISIRHWGLQPNSIYINDSASSQSSINFYNSGDLTLNGSQSFSTSAYGSMQIASGGILNVAAGISGYDVNLGGSIIDVNAGVTADNNVQLLGTTININSGGSIDAGNNVALMTPLFGGTINLYGGSVTASGSAATSSFITASNGISLPYTGIAFVAGNLYASGSGAYLEATDTTIGNISGLVTGDITLDYGASFRAGKDVDLVLAGSASMLNLLNGGYILASPTTIKLDFPGRFSGGLNISGGGGLFVGSFGNVATPGAGLVLTYAPIVDNTVSNDIGTATGGADTGSTPIDPPPESIPPAPEPDPFQSLLDPNATTGGTEDTFGWDDQVKDETKREKQAQKKYSQCT